MTFDPSPSRQKTDESRTRLFSIDAWEGGEKNARDDRLVVEEPMEIRLLFGPQEKRAVRSLSVTMRTPGEDEELAAGFLFTEGILHSPEQIEAIEARGTDAAGQPTGNTIRVALRPEVEVDFAKLQRHFYTSSSCGVCGKASLEMLELRGARTVETTWTISAEAIRQLPDRLRAAQPTFELTGGLHAAGLFNSAGQLQSVREDVGRHNAVDKLFGRAFLDRQMPLDRFGLVISGRVSFEIMQKALAARVPIIIAVGAPTSLAVELAAQYGLTLVGFTSAKRMNVYAGGKRVGN
ncbi:MAG: formate dehydrogenase accessory sulfurtransferase FdhD [Planctomycetota bacterium]|jgi:FdhD protein|nr:formate dehydrogenase accessory sulfurtransferase FdhD [Blastopirellula sp.]